MEDSPATRQATKARIGPWYVLQSRNPAAPGMKYATLLALIHRGHVTGKSVVRGPTTHQLWRFAAHVRGVSREFEVCYSCGGSIDRSASLCSHCQRLQDPPNDPDVLLEPRVHRPSPEEESPSHSQRLRDLNRARQRAESKTGNGDSNPRARTEMAVSGNGRVLSGMNLAAALQHAREPEQPGHRKRKALLVVVVLTALLATGMFYARPELREQAVGWAQRTWETVRSKWSTATAPEKPAPPRDTAAVPTREPLPAPVILPQTREARTEVTAQPEVDAEAAATKAAQKVAAAPVETPPPAPVVAANPLEQSRALWRAAIDAEARRDNALAVKLYEQIKQLPPDVWPAGLQLRLEMAQKRVGQAAGN
jgi:hypothetical protein